MQKKRTVNEPDPTVKRSQHAKVPTIAHYPAHNPADASAFPCRQWAHWAAAPRSWEHQLNVTSFSHELLLNFAQNIIVSMLFSSQSHLQTIMADSLDRKSRWNWYWNVSVIRINAIKQFLSLVISRLFDESKCLLWKKVYSALVSLWFMCAHPQKFAESFFCTFSF